MAYLKIKIELLIYLILASSTIFNVLGQQKSPSFIFILTDVQPYDCMGCTGNPIVKPPNLDIFASEGVLFDNVHITSVICTPSRISILLS